MSALPDERDPQQFRLAILIGVLLGGLNLSRFNSMRYGLDDAWISFRIARNWVEEGVPTFDLTQPPVEGMTNLLWTILSAIVYATTRSDPFFLMRICGAMCFLGTIVLLAYVAARDVDHPVLAAGVTSVLVGVSGTLAFYSMSGLETGLWALLFSLSINELSAVKSGQVAASARCGFWLGLLAMTRPEGVLIGGVVCVWVLWRTRLTRSSLVLIALFSILVGGMEGWRLWTYGELVPNTFYAKPPSMSHGSEYLSWYLVEGTGLLIFASVIPAIRRGEERALVACIAALMMAGTLWSGGDWMPGYRRLVVPSLCLAVLAGNSVGSIGVSAARWWVFPGLLLWLVANVSMMIFERDSSLYSHGRWEALASLLDEQPQIEEVALVDIGRFGWAFRGSIFDLAGLIDHTVARQEGEMGVKAFPEKYFQARAPDVVLAICDIPFSDPLPRFPRCRSHEKEMMTSLLKHGGYQYRAAIELSDDPAGHQGLGFLLLFLRDDKRLPEEQFGPDPKIDLQKVMTEAYNRSTP